MKKLFLFILLIIFGYHNSFAQPEKNLTNRDKYDYMFGLSYLTSGYLFNKEYANPFQNLSPSGRFFMDKHLADTWSIEGALGYESIALSPYKDSDTTIRFDSIYRYTFDIHSKFSTGRFVRSNFIEPYFIFGGGFTYHYNFGINLNTGIGLNLWLTNNMGLQAQSVVKIPLSTQLVDRSYLQTNFGLVIRFSKPAIPAGDFGKRRYKFSKRRTRIKVPKNKGKGT